MFSLHVAAARGQTDCLSVILAHGADPSITDAAGMYCCERTCGKSDHFSQYLYLRDCCCPLRVFLVVFSIILSKLWLKYVCLTKVLVKEFLNLCSGFNPLHLAAKNNHTECCKKLIQVRRLKCLLNCFVTCNALKWRTMWQLAAVC